MKPNLLSLVGCLLPWVVSVAGHAAEPSSSADRDLAAYFQAETHRIAAACLADVRTVEDWQRQREERRRQLFEMLGLWPFPARTDLQPVVTGRLDQGEFTVEKLHFQSLPGLYVTANLYLPRTATAPLPAILYVCGHAEVKTNGVSLGNKTAYQHHAIWFARHGYVCLVLDTLQLGEIQGDHHGTYRLGQWDWNSRGYTPAGVEAWNCIRALDYLESRAEVDRTRIGMTGRSGGGSYTWTTAALDDRVKVAAPVAGITDLQNHVVDGTVEGHCDCMFFVNTYRWDFALNAALIAPRPLLIVNTDADTIFPLDGVERVHAQVRRLYQLHGASGQLGLVVGPGPHQDTQDLQVPVFRWFNHHLRHEDPLITDAAVRTLAPDALRVFGASPPDQINTRIQETFTARTRPEAEAPGSAEDVRRRLLAQVFHGWPTEPPPVRMRSAGSTVAQGLQLSLFDFESQEHVPLRLYFAKPAGRARPHSVRLHVLDADGWTQWASGVGAAFARSFPQACGSDVVPAGSGTDLRSLASDWKAQRVAHAWFAPRGLGLTAWSGDPRKHTHIRRRFMLLGQTLDGMRVWDIRRAIQAVRATPALASSPLTLEARGPMGVNAVYASLFEDGLQELEVPSLPASHREGPDYLNVLQVLDIPQATALARQRLRVNRR